MQTAHEGTNQLDPLQGQESAILGYCKSRGIPLGIPHKGAGGRAKKVADVVLWVVWVCRHVRGSIEAH